MDKQKPDYEKVFNMFSNMSGLKQELYTPFRQHNLYAATDACSMIYMPTSVADLPFEEQNETIISNVIPLILHEEIPLDVQKLDDAIKEFAPMIDEWKVINTTCLKCGGDGEISCNLGHLHDCSGCSGSGEKSERKRTGLKIPNAETVFKFNGMGADDIGIHYKQLIRLVSAAKELGESTIYKVYGKNRNPHVFKVGETSVLVMPALIVDNPNPISLPFDFHFQPKQ